MKRLFTLLFLIWSVTFGYSQTNYCHGSFDFDNLDDYCFESLIIDTVNNPNNIWQVGKPQKVGFDSAYSFPNVIITDTLNPYPVNDTSSFIVANRESGGFNSPHTAEVYGYYNVDTDSLNDYGIIELSLDSGLTWIDIINDTNYWDYIYWNPSKPVLTGNSNGWQPFHVRLERLGQIFEIEYGANYFLRFTFISDSIPDTLGGLMFDDFDFENYVESLEEYDLVKSKVYPNPSRDLVTFDFENKQFAPFDLRVYDYMGRLVDSRDGITNDRVTVDVSDFSPGFYNYELTNPNDKQRAWGKFVVE